MAAGVARQAYVAYTHPCTAPASVSACVRENERGLLSVASSPAEFAARDQLDFHQRRPLACSQPLAVSLPRLAGTLEPRHDRTVVARTLTRRPAAVAHPPSRLTPPLPHPATLTRPASASARKVRLHLASHPHRRLLPSLLVRRLLSPSGNDTHTLGPAAMPAEEENACCGLRSRACRGR